MKKMFFLLSFFVSIFLYFSTAHSACTEDFIKIWEVCFWPAEGESQWIELNNIHPEDSFNFNGVEIKSNGGSYVLPDELEMVPPSGKIVVYFDNEIGTDDFSFEGDNKAILHASIADGESFLGNPGGFCALYRSESVYSAETILDFVAWGEAPGSEANNAVEKRLWANDSVFIATSGDAEKITFGPSSESISQGGVIARLNGAWITNKQEDATPGGEYTPELVSPNTFSPSDGIQVLQIPSFWWEKVVGAETYEFQIAKDEFFSELVFSLETDSAYVEDSQIEIPIDNNYFWRVRAIGEGITSDWSNAIFFTVGFLPEEFGLSDFSDSEDSVSESRRNRSGDEFRVSGVVKEQYDGRLFPLEGARIIVGDQSTLSSSSGEFVLGEIPSGEYDIIVEKDFYDFPSRSISIGDSDISGLEIIGQGKDVSLGIVPLGARKDTTMLAITPGSASKKMCDKDGRRNQAWDFPNPRSSHKSDDLESWWCWAVAPTMFNNYYGGTVVRDQVVYEVKGDLLHDSDAGANFKETQEALYYVLDADADRFEWFSSKPEPEQVAESIDSGNPIHYTVLWPKGGGHVMVIGGYRLVRGKFFVQVLNTDNNAKVEYWEWTKALHYATGFIKESFDPSLTAIEVDARILSDSDSDGVCDFDEEERFQSDENSSDTDGDGIPDKIEIMSWVFPRESNGSLMPSFFKVFNSPDIDKDGLFPEADEDTDGGGLRDGLEDQNGDAIWDIDLEETDVYDPKDDGLLDLVFCIDTTASMGDDIEEVKEYAIEIVNNIEDNFGNFRIALVDYRDFPSRTEASIDYPAKTQLDFSSDKEAIVDAINGLDLGDGGDWYETVYSGIVHSMDNLSGWRKEAQRMIVVMGDAPALNPEPITGFTGLYVAAKAFLGGIERERIELSPGTRSRKALSYSGSIPVYTIPTEYYSEDSFLELSESTGGEMIPAFSSTEVPDALLEAVQSAKSKPIASVFVVGGIGDAEITADARDSRDLEGCGIVSYEWDWNNDGIFEETTTDPVVSHSFDEEGFKGEMRVKVTNTSGAEGVAVYFSEAEGIVDQCPDDPVKDLPGVCGCGVPDTDTDGDGTPDCIDECPNDATNTCNDTVYIPPPPVRDSDGDGTTDPFDDCPNDPGKTRPGLCGCGAPDTDSDDDGTPDCIDECPGDPEKIETGECGCGTTDIDTDEDGVSDCVDNCPEDPAKTEPGVCGCGVADVDSDDDGVMDCVDECPADPEKTQAGVCGCGIPDVDTDEDGTFDCDDQCPDDPAKTEPGVCGCGVGDTDTDSDGTPDCNDNCPADPEKTEPGLRGCGVSENTPMADAGEDLSVNEGVAIRLNGANSSDPNGLPLSFHWEQTGGTPVVLSSATVDQPTFVPVVPAGSETKNFRLTIRNDSGMESSDEVAVTVTNSEVDGYPEDVLPIICATGKTMGTKTGSGNLVWFQAENPVVVEEGDNGPDDQPYGMMDALVKVGQPGETAVLTFYLSEPAPENSDWYAHDEADGWRMLSEYATFNEDRDEVTLTLTDGGPADADGTADGTITLDSGLGVNTVEDDGGDGGICLIASAASGSGSGESWKFMAFLLVMGIALSGKKRQM
jgi:hypothetical protein